MELTKHQIVLLLTLFYFDLSQQVLTNVYQNSDSIKSSASHKKPVSITPHKIINRFRRKSLSDPSCGRSKIKHTGLITGSQTNPGDWPWHVAIYRMKRNREYICGGSLLTMTRVLTAGHCVVENGAVLIPERLIVLFGKFNLNDENVGLQEKGVYQIVLHPEFSYDTLKNDIAILKLLSEVKYTEYIQPICLWNRNHTEREEIVNTEGTIVGWGLAQEDIESNKLMKLTMPVVSDSKCLKHNEYFYKKYLSNYTYCAGFANGTSACNGDSGGGMFFPKMGNDGLTIWYVRGIVSLGVPKNDENKCDSYQYTLFTDVAQYLDFVHTNLNIIDEGDGEFGEIKEIGFMEKFGNFWKNLF